MKAIETTVVVGEDHKVTLQLPPDVTPGPHHVIVVVDGPRGQQPSTWTMADWPVHDAGLTDPDFTMRREELYGDNGR
jgi:hypothetical protein